MDEQVPSWNGDLSVLEDFETDVEHYVDGTPEKDRGTCGPRVARRLTGRARAALLGMTREQRERLKTPEGAGFLVAYLKEKIGGAPALDVGKY